MCRSEDSYAVAIPYDKDECINESFVGITLSTNMLNYFDKSFKTLYLKMHDTGDLKKFIYIATEFLDIKNRNSILTNPYEWVDDWTSLFGNSNKKYLISDVIAELYSLKLIYEEDKTAKWSGPLDGTYDIVCENSVYEVKSTTHKKNSYISINSRFQLSTDVNEQLMFVRLEPKPYSNSIDSLVYDLIKLGYNEYELENSLNILGYRKGNRTRKKAFNILSMNLYDVNFDNFPIIKLEDLNDMTTMKNIIGYKLELDLSTIPSKVFK